VLLIGVFLSLRSTRGAAIRFLCGMKFAKKAAAGRCAARQGARDREGPAPVDHVWAWHRRCAIALWFSEIPTSCAERRTR
jgi:hypothetical protein